MALLFFKVAVKLPLFNVILGPSCSTLQKSTFIYFFMTWHNLRNYCFVFGTKFDIKYRGFQQLF